MSQLHLFNVRCAIFDLQQAHGVTDTEMLLILTRAAADIATRLPEERTP